MGECVCTIDEVRELIVQPKGGKARKRKNNKYGKWIRKQQERSNEEECLKIFWHSSSFEHLSAVEILRKVQRIVLDNDDE